MVFKNKLNIFYIGIFLYIKVNQLFVSYKSFPSN